MLSWMTEHLFQNSAKLSELYPIKVHWLKNLAELWAKVVGGGKKGLFALLTLWKTKMIMNTCIFESYSLLVFAVVCPPTESRKKKLNNSASE